MPPMPRAAASRITSTGKCFSSSQRIACGAIFSAAKSRAISRTAIWSSLSVNWVISDAIPSPEPYGGQSQWVRAKRGPMTGSACPPFAATVSPDGGHGEGAPLPTLRTSSRPYSVHRRDRELRAVLDTGRPARGDRLGLGIEAYRVRSVLIEIAEARALPAAERVVSDRHRNRHVDADHADIDP